MWGSNNVDRTFNINLRILANGNNVVTKQLLLTNNAPSLSPIPSAAFGFNWFAGENGDPVPGNPGGSANPFLIYITTAGGMRIGDSLGFINLLTHAFNGSASTALSHDEITVNKDGAVTSQTILELNQRGSTIDLNTNNDPTYMQSVLGSHLLKIRVNDANNIAGSEHAYYSTWIKILQ
jgi:hypothetical protein